MIKRAQQRFAELTGGSCELRDLAAGHELKFELVDDYGDSAVRLVTLEEGQLHFA